MKNSSFKVLFIILGVIPMIFWAFRYLNFDLWYDEVYSLEHFALVDFSTTVFYYPAPNNHIFYNLINQIVSRIFGIRDIISAEKYSVIFRLFQLLLSVLTSYYLIQFVKKYFNSKSTFVVLVILFTTIPFMNFSLQLRGYGLSTLFLIMIVYYSMDYFEARKNKTLVFLAVLSCVLMYTIPSNLYSIVGIFTAIGVFFTASFWNKDYQNVRACIKVLLAMGIGMCIAAVFYIPIWEDLIHNKFSDKSATGTFQSLGIFIASIPQFFSKRYLLLLLIIPGIYLLINRKFLKQKVVYMGLLIIFVIPYIASFVHQKSPYPRVFITLAPIFVLLITIPGIIFLDFLSSKKRQILQLLVPLYCIGVFIYEVNKNDTLIEENLLKNNAISQNLYQNYYLANFFQQDKTIKHLSAINKGTPIVMFQQRDEPSTELYLKKYHLDAQKIETIKMLQTILKQHHDVFVLTSHKEMVLDELRNIEGLSIEALTPENSFTSILKIRSN